MFSGTFEESLDHQIGVYIAASSNFQASLCFVPMLLYAYVVGPCLKWWREKKEEKRTVIHIGRPPTEYQRLFQQEPAQKLVTAELVY